jgi:hypothetical protein
MSALSEGLSVSALARPPFSPARRFWATTDGSLASGSRSSTCPVAMSTMSLPSCTGSRGRGLRLSVMRASGHHRSAARSSLAAPARQAIRWLALERPLQSRFCLPSPGLAGKRRAGYKGTAGSGTSPNLRAGRGPTERPAVTRNMTPPVAPCHPNPTGIYSGKFKLTHYPVARQAWRITPRPGRGRPARPCREPVAHARRRARASSARIARNARGPRSADRCTRARGIGRRRPSRGRCCPAARCRRTRSPDASPCLPSRPTRRSCAASDLRMA